MTPLLRSGLLLLTLAACKAGGPAPVAPAAAPVSASSSLEAAMEKLDTRVPVPLLPHMANHQKENMRDHLLAVQEIALGAARNDFSAIDEAATKLGLSPGMEGMCNHMGMGAAGFTEQALKFHRSADDIAAAARKRDSPEVMKALGVTLQLCTGCHATYRQKIVDEATWTRLTATTAPSPRAHGLSGG